MSDDDWYVVPLRVAMRGTNYAEREDDELDGLLVALARPRRIRATTASVTRRESDQSSDEKKA